MSVKINFVNNKSIKELELEDQFVPLKLDDKINQALLCFSPDAFNFDFNNLEAHEELNLLIEIFQVTLKNEFTYSSIETYTNATVEALSYMEFMSSQLTKQFYHKDVAGEKILAQYFMAIKELLSIKDEYINNREKMTKIFKKIEKLKEVRVSETLNILKDFIKFFHETDFMIENMFKLYLSFQKNTDLFCFIHNNYENDKLLEEFRKNTIKKVININEIIPQTFKSMESIIFQIFNYKQSIMDSIFIQYRIKKVIDEKEDFEREKIDSAEFWEINQRNYSTIIPLKSQDHLKIYNKSSTFPSLKLYKNCFFYFKRFYELALLKNEMVENISVAVRFKTPVSIIPKVLFKCHYYTMEDKNKLRDIKTLKEEKVDNFLKNNLNHTNTIEAVLDECYKTFGVVGAECFIHHYIQINLERFFSEEFRLNFNLYAETIDYNFVAFYTNPLIEFFQAYLKSDDNKSIILFIFDHIIE
jgi:hypothetical protein